VNDTTTHSAHHQDCKDVQRRYELCYSMAKLGIQSQFGHGIAQFIPSLISIQDLFHPYSWQTPVAAATVHSAPDDGRKGRPKHVEFWHHIKNKKKKLNFVGVYMISDRRSEHRVLGWGSYTRFSPIYAYTSLFITYECFTYHVMSKGILIVTLSCFEEVINPLAPEFPFKF